MNLVGQRTAGDHLVWLSQVYQISHPQFSFSVSCFNCIQSQAGTMDRLTFFLKNIVSRNLFLLESTADHKMFEYWSIAHERMIAKRILKCISGTKCSLTHAMKKSKSMISLFYYNFVHSHFFCLVYSLINRICIIAGKGT